MSLRPSVRRLTHSVVRHRWRSRDELAVALRAFTRVLRLNRQLARLAPAFFDPVVVDREARERVERHQREAECDAALDKIYGPSPDASSAAREPQSPPLPGPRTIRAVDAQLAERAALFAVGSAAFRRHRKLWPHAVPSLSQTARLLSIACDLGRWAVGLPFEPPPPEPPLPDPWADLRRAYPGKPPAPVQPSAPGPAAQPALPSGNPPPSVPVTPAQVSPPAPPQVAADPPRPVGRRDAWATWARMRRAS